MCFLVPGARAIALDVSTERVERALDRGVSIKAVFATSILADEAVRAHARWLVSRGADVRAAPSLPPALVVVDRSTALVPADPQSATAFVVTNRALATALARLFDLVWNAAQGGTHNGAQRGTARGGRRDAPSPQERDLLDLLSTGLTDAAAARQLGVSLRTVRRMMAEIMTRLRARSRFEAGMRAAERGWVSSGRRPSVAPGVPRRSVRPERARADRRARPLGMAQS
jgi:DNA-binding CsgD family transcriptional regulator